MIDRPKPIDVTLVPEDQRFSVPAKLLGHYFLAVENAVYYFANKLSADYHGGYWDFYTLSNGGFYMAPSVTDTYHLSCDKFFEGDLLATAFGITCCFYAYSNLSFSEESELSKLCTKHYPWLREVILDHPDGGKILAAAD